MLSVVDPTKQAARARASARRRGLPTNLSGEEWLKTINDFQGACAYCGGLYQTLDHYIPMSYSGGSTVDNCVPSCLTCNRSKASSLPSAILPKDVVCRVSGYLEQRGRLYIERQARLSGNAPAAIIQQPEKQEKEQKQMTTKETRCRIQSLSSGKEIRIFSNGQIRFQLRDQSGDEDGRGCSYSTDLTPLETYELGLNLLRMAHPHVEQGLIGGKEVQTFSF